MRRRLRTAGGLAKHFGFGRHKVYYWQKNKPDFPKFVHAEPDKVWDLDEVEEWMLEQGFWDPISAELVDARFFPRCVNCGHAAIA